MKKPKQHPANVVDVSSRIMGLLGRRKVDPTTDAMKAFKPGFEMRDYQQPAIDATEWAAQHEQNPEPIDVPRFALPLHLQQSGRFMRQPGLTPDEQKRLIYVLERMLRK